MNNDELKACPFCGHQGINFHQDTNLLGYHYCYKCWGRCGSEVQTFEQSVKSWNTRDERSGFDSNDLYDIALNILIPLMNHCNNPETLKPFGIPNDITLKAVEILKRSPQGLKPLSEQELAKFLFESKEVQSAMLFDKLGCEGMAKIICSKFAVPNEGLNEKCLTSILSELEDELASNWGIKNTRRSYANDYAKRILSALENKR